MVISLNSLDSNTSPHSRHSTNSESSSRDTMRTRGCLHSAVASLLGNWGRRDWLHKSGLNSCPSGSGQRRRKVGGILALVLRLSRLEISSRELRCATAQACSCKVRAGRSMQNRNLASATCMSSADFSQIQTIFVAMVTLLSSISGEMTFFEPVPCVGCIYHHGYLGLSWLRF